MTRSACGRRRGGSLTACSHRRRIVDPSPAVPVAAAAQLLKLGARRLLSLGSGLRLGARLLQVLLGLVEGLRGSIPTLLSQLEGASGPLRSPPRLALVPALSR